MNRPTAEALLGGDDGWMTRRLRLSPRAGTSAHLAGRAARTHRQCDQCLSQRAPKSVA
jgi:hypothetical protein